MKSNYKKLKPFISPRNSLNDGMEVKELLGISNQKYFQKSHTNTIGIDLSTYRIVRTNQFAYNRATTRNGEKISIALRQGDDCIVSPSYRIFQVNNENELLSEYLLMWFKRPEFDRYVRFKSHGSAHEFFEYDQMCDVELPIPTITKQREIVKEYNVILNRIAINQQLIKKLEETAQAIYKQWFVEFEFPDENGKSYKSGGGIMVWNEELGKDIPKGWKLESIGFLANNIYSGGTPSTEIEEYWNGEHYWFSSGETGNKYIFQTEKTITQLGIKNSTSKKVERLSTVIATAGQGKTRGQSALLFIDLYINQSVIAIKPLRKEFSFFIFLNVNSRYLELRNDSDAQSIRGSINSKDIKSLPVIVPNLDELLVFHNIISPFFEVISNKIKQNIKMSEMKDLLLSKLATIEN